MAFLVLFGLLEGDLEWTRWPFSGSRWQYSVQRGGWRRITGGSSGWTTSGTSVDSVAFSNLTVVGADVSELAGRLEAYPGCG
ncbi:MAG: hypothetical protein CM1200mP26_30620 [Acidimicrobiales bacterium]|nr:MAG: hypothetical protein CM1200mP26_30620 [Acidimicrobiales bacterium]